MRVYTKIVAKADKAIKRMEISASEYVKRNFDKKNSNYYKLRLENIEALKMFTDFAHELLKKENEIKQLIETQREVFKDTYSKIIRRMYAIGVISFGVSPSYLAASINNVLCNDEFHEIIQVESPILTSMLFDASNSAEIEIYKKTKIKYNFSEIYEHSKEMLSVGAGTIRQIDKNIKNYIKHNPKQYHTVHFQNRLRDIQALKELYNETFDVFNNRNTSIDISYTLQKEYANIISRIFTVMTLVVGVPTADFWAIQLADGVEDKYLKKMADQTSKDINRYVDIAVNNVQKLVNSNLKKIENKA